MSERTFTSEYAQAWRPESVGDRVSGIVTELATRDAGYGDYPIVTLRQANGEEIAVHCFVKMLREDVGDKAKIGDRVQIVFEGETKSKAGRPYKKYKSLVEGKRTADEKAPETRGDEPF